ncbi:MAG: zinc ribbon domain-containing protein [Candidatus Obscuribacterales bacterium]|nr:zinc ribbon domain-containing protein [Candidatus Obscuribacterales bacterium]
MSRDTTVVDKNYAEEKACIKCRRSLEARAKFCGNCGSEQPKMVYYPEMQSVQIGQISPLNHHNHRQLSLSQELAMVGSRVAQARQESLSSPNQNLVTRENSGQEESRAVYNTPEFAKRRKRRIPVELKEELAALQLSKAKQKAFLLMHWIIFLISNLIGLYIALKCYFEYNGDEVAKIMVATTPLMFINLTALVCLSPIKGTKRELARLKERETYIRLELEVDAD